MIAGGGGRGRVVGSFRRGRWGSRKRWVRLAIRSATEHTEDTEGELGSIRNLHEALPRDAEEDETMDLHG